MKPDRTAYQGTRFPNPITGSIDTASDGAVVVDGSPLTHERSYRYVKHSPDGFNWGYAGSGPSQLAFAILLDFTGDVHLALNMYQDFKRDFVARFEDTWTLTGFDIRKWLSQKGLPV